MLINTLRLELVRKSDSEAHLNVSSVDAPLEAYNFFQSGYVRGRRAIYSVLKALHITRNRAVQ